MAKAKKSQNRPHSNVHLSPPHPYTVVARNSSTNHNQPPSLAIKPLDDMDAEDDNICPVCESECTCSNNFSAIPPMPPSPPPPPVQRPKIKLILSSRPPNQAAAPTTTKALRDDGDVSSPLTSDPDTPPTHIPPPVRKRGRPPKSVLVAREAAAKAAAQVTPGRPATRRKLPAKRGPGRPPKNKNLYVPVRPPCAIPDSDTESDTFPTFVSAPSSSNDTSSDSDSDSTDLLSSSDLSDDDSIVAEEEQLIIAESHAHQKARVVRELLGDNANNHNGGSRKWERMNWGSMPRHKSVDGEQVDSGVETDADTDGTDGDDESDEDADADPDGDPERGVALASWTSEEDEECDADFFFANLSDSSFALSSDDEAMQDSVLNNQADDDDSVLDPLDAAESVEPGLLASFSSTRIGSVPRGKKSRKSPRLPLVVTEDWEGQLVFANGLKDDETLMDIGFDAPPPAESMCVDDQTETEDDESVGWEVESDAEGNTTAEDEPFSMDDEMTMSLTLPPPPPKPAYPSLSAFRFPTPPPPSVDPKSTFSSPVNSPGPRAMSRSLNSLTSPKPADILARSPTIFWDSQSSTLTENSQDIMSPSNSLRSLSPRHPTMGTFSLPGIGNARVSAIIGTEGGSNIPCPFAHLRRKNSRGRSRTNHGRSDIFIQVARRSREVSTPRPQSMDSFTGSCSLASPSDSTSDNLRTSPERTLTNSMELDDVLDSSLIHEHDEWLGVQTLGSSDENHNLAVLPESHIKNITRWSRVPMGTFRRSSSAAWTSDQALASSGRAPGVLIVGIGNSGARMPIPVSDGFSYGAAAGHALRTPYESPTLWDASPKTPNVKAESLSPTHRPSSGRKRKLEDRRVLVSPIIFPVQESSHEAADILPSTPRSPSKGIDTPTRRTISVRPSRSSSNVSTFTIPPLDLDA